GCESSSWCFIVRLNAVLPVVLAICSWKDPPGSPKLPVCLILSARSEDEALFAVSDDAEFLKPPDVEVHVTWLVLKLATVPWLLGLAPDRTVQPVGKPLPM